MNAATAITERNSETETPAAAVCTDERTQSWLPAYLASVAKTVFRGMNPRDFLKPEPPGIEHWLQIEYRNAVETRVGEIMNRNSIR